MTGRNGDDGNSGAATGVLPDSSSVDFGFVVTVLFTSRLAHTEEYFSRHGKNRDIEWRNSCAGGEAFDNSRSPWLSPSQTIATIR
jgi:hypothetical protein